VTYRKVAKTGYSSCSREVVLLPLVVSRHAVYATASTDNSTAQLHSTTAIKLTKTQHRKWIHFDKSCCELSVPVKSAPRVYEYINSNKTSFILTYHLILNKNKTCTLYKRLIFRTCQDGMVQKLTNISAIIVSELFCVFWQKVKTFF